MTEDSTILSAAQKKELAVQMRQAGSTYPQIAEATGYSLDWCKKNLGGVEKNQNERKAVKEAIKLAQCYKGITNGEIQQLIQTVYPYEDSKEYEQLMDKAMRRFKASINRAPNTLIRPYWMSYGRPQESFNLLLQATDTIMQTISSEVEFIRKQLDYNDSFDKSLRHAIINMLYCGGKSIGAVTADCERYENLVNQLKDRNSGLSKVGGPESCTDDAQVYYSPKKCNPLSPSVQECESAICTFSESEGDFINNLFWEAYDDVQTN